MPDKKKGGVQGNPSSVPSTVAEPFPDNVSKPFWAFKEKRCLADEFFDAYVSFKELQCEEYFWEWKSRKIDETLMKNLTNSYRAFFSENPIGSGRFLTFMVNNDNLKDLGKLYMSIILSNEFAKDSGFPNPPLFEVVHNATTSDSLLHFINLYNESVSIACDKFRKDVGPKNISIIPTHDFSKESSDWFKTLHSYITDYQQMFRARVERFRPLIPRSSIADKAGFVGAVLATKRALSNYHAFSKILGVDTYPIIQASVLPFRGGLAPGTVKDFALNYPGLRSVTLSSAFRYDFPVENVIGAVRLLNKGLSRIPKKIFAKEEGLRIKRIEDVFAKHYAETVKNMPAFTRINDAMDVHPQIRKTFALYSLGVPPEFIGTGHALLEMIKEKMVKDLENIYPTIKQDLITAGRLLNKENLNMLSKTGPFWNSLLKDVSLVEDYVGGSLGPKESEDFVHRNHTSNVFHKMSAGKDFNDDLKAAATARHCLG
ncbi:TPA: phosphoenolpyruvate carboxylase [Candidatus Woesearchaeota archaeon]|nr:phosphoenolpyruvate carboxylase [Candidatus Woesearchaeota archaeon]